MSRRDLREFARLGAESYPPLLIGRSSWAERFSQERLLELRAPGSQALALRYGVTHEEAANAYLAHGNDAEAVISAAAQCHVSVEMVSNLWRKIGKAPVGA